MLRCRNFLCVKRMLIRSISINNLKNLSLNMSYLQHLFLSFLSCFFVSFFFLGIDTLYTLSNVTLSSAVMLILVSVVSQTIQNITNYSDWQIFYTRFPSVYVLWNGRKVHSIHSRFASSQVVAYITSSSKKLLQLFINIREWLEKNGKRGSFTEIGG